MWPGDSSSNHYSSSTTAPQWPSDELPEYYDLPLFRQPASRQVPGPYSLTPIHRSFSFGGPSASCWMNGGVDDMNTARLLDNNNPSALCQCSIRAPRIAVRYDNNTGCCFPGGGQPPIVTPIHLLFRLLASASQSCAAKTDPRRWERRYPH